MTQKRLHSFIFGIVLLFSADLLISSEAGNPQGYTDIVPFRDQSVAVGTDGRIDRLSKSGECATLDHSSAYPLNSVFANDEILIAAGDHGTILFSKDGSSFSHSETGTDENINDVSDYTELILAGADNGLVLVSIDGQLWEKIQTAAKGNILSLSSNHSLMIGITDAGEIIKSADGLNWEIMNYNEAYAGYNPHVHFKKILTTDDNILIIGNHDDGSPAILVSTSGNVWAERSPVFHDDEGRICFLTNKLNGITYDPDGDQFFLACAGGVVFSLSNCTKCNKWLKLSESHLNAVCYADNCLFIAGDDYSFFIQRL